MLYQDQQYRLIQEHVLLGKITVTLLYIILRIFTICSQLYITEMAIIKY